MILSCGEALIDMLPRSSTLGEAAFAPYAGGAVFNTAMALGRLGAPSGFFSGVSNDMLGEILGRISSQTAKQVLMQRIQARGGDEVAAVVDALDALTERMASAKNALDQAYV